MADSSETTGEEISLLQTVPATEIGLELGEGYEQRDTEHSSKSNKTNSRYKPYTKPSGHNNDTSDFKLFVTNLPFTVDDHAFAEHMSKVAPVMNAVVFRNPSGSSRGMGVVEYENAEIMERAIVEMNETELEGRSIYVRKYVDQNKNLKNRDVKVGVAMPLNRPNDKPRPPANPAATVYVNNLDYTCNWQQLKDAFKAAGKVVYCEIQVDQGGKSKGMGFVQFERPIEALNALALFHGQMFFNRGLIVRMDNRSPIKPDPMTVKQVLGGSSNVFGTQPQVAGNVMGLSASLGLSPQLLQSLGVVDTYQTVPATNQYAVVTAAPPTGGECSSYTNTASSQAQTYVTYPQTYTTQSQTQPQTYTTQPQTYTAQPQTYTTQPQTYTAQPQTYAVQYVPVEVQQNYIWQQQQQQSYLYSPAPSSSGKRIKIKNLNFRTPWQRLKDLFRQAGNVQFVDILQGSDGRPNGTACILFDSIESAASAVSMFNNTEIDGRKVEIFLDTQGD